MAQLLDFASPGVEAFGGFARLLRKRLHGIGADQVDLVSQSMKAAQAKGTQQGIAMMRCHQLRRERLEMDNTDKAGTLTDLRLAIRQEQFKLGCKQN